MLLGNTQGGTTALSTGVTFGFGGVTLAPPNTQATIGQASQCMEDDGITAIANTACIMFNSRGVPIDSSFAPTGDALYVTDGMVVYGVTVARPACCGCGARCPSRSRNWVRQLIALKSERGTTLIETSIATSLLLVVMVGLLSMAALATVYTENHGHLEARTTEYAQDKMEQLLALVYTDQPSNTVFFPAAPTGGTGLSVGGSADTAAPVNGYVDWLSQRRAISWEAGRRPARELVLSAGVAGLGPDGQRQANHRHGNREVVGRQCARSQVDGRRAEIVTVLGDA